MPEYVETPGGQLCLDQLRNLRDYSRRNGCETAVMASGIVQSDRLLDEAANSAGQSTEFKMRRPLEDTSTDATEPFIGGECPPADKAGGLSFKGRKSALVNIWVGEDAIEFCAGAGEKEKLLRHLMGTTKYWSRQYERKAIEMLLGLMEHNYADYGGDMITDLGVDAPLTMDNLVAAEQDTGCSVIFDGAITNCHTFHEGRKWSNDYARMEVSETTSTNGDPILVGNIDGRAILPTCNTNWLNYSGAATGGQQRKVSILFKRGVVGLGYGDAPDPVETDRVPCAHGGWGSSKYIERTLYMMHPYGYHWLEADMERGANTLVPSSNDLRNPANWERVVDREEIPLAFLLH